MLSLMFMKAYLSRYATLNFLNYTYLFNLCMFACVWVCHVPGIKFRSSSFVTSTVIHGAIRSPTPRMLQFWSAIFSSRWFSYLHLHHHLQLSNKVFLTGTSFLKHWLFTCPMKWKPSVLSLSALTSNFHTLPLWNLKLNSHYCSFV